MVERRETRIDDVTQAPSLVRALERVLPFRREARPLAVRSSRPPSPRVDAGTSPHVSIELDDTLPFFRPTEPPPMPLDRFVEWSVLEQDDPEAARAFLLRCGFDAPNLTRRALGYWQHRIRTDDAFCQRFRALRDFYVNTRAALGRKPEGARK